MPTTELKKNIEKMAVKRRRIAVSTDFVTERLRRKIVESGLPRGAQFSSRRNIAEEFGVSLGTVQLAVKALVTEGYLETRGNTGTVIGASASRTPTVESYRITPTARGYIGIVTHDRQASAHGPDHWRTQLIHGIEREAADLGHPTLYHNLYVSEGQDRTPLDGITDVIVAGAEAVIGVFLDEEEGMLQLACRAAWSSRPIIFAATGPLRLPAIHCSYDSISDGYRAALHLIDAGCKKLLYLSGYGREWSADRLQGARAAVEHNGNSEIHLTERVHTSNAHVGPKDGVVAGRAMAHEVLASGLRFDGVVAANDQFAFGWMDAAKEFGLAPSKDFLIVGFDDLEESQTRGLTTLRPPIEGIGIQCARLAVAALRREEHPSHVCLRSHLVIRKSTRFQSC